MKIKYKLNQIYPGIYFCKINDTYDLALTFCRAQEFYESPIKEIRGKKFTLVELMARYAKKNQGSFSYPLDWAGFNIPGPVIDNLYKNGVSDENIYDKVIIDIHNKVIKDVGSTHYYLIGSNSDKCTILHECCHALFFLDKEYRESTKAILKKLHASVRRKAVSVLYELGYDKSVIDDELQAYFTTEFHSLKSKQKFNKRELINLTNVVLAFKDNFKKYRKKIKI